MKNKKVIITGALLGLTGILIIFASGLVNIQPPAQQTGGPGFVYTAEYECGQLISTASNPQAEPGRFATNISLHNPFSDPANVFIKVLPVTGPPRQSMWLSMSATTIAPDGALDITCNDITGNDPGSSPFSKGFVVVSQPSSFNVTEGIVVLKQPVFPDESLDAVASYTFLANSTGTSSQNTQSQFFDKIVVKVKDIVNGKTKFKLFDLIIPADPNAPLSDLKKTIVDTLKAKGVTIKSKTVVEIITIEFGVNGGGSASSTAAAGGSKNVVTINGKFVPFVPLPPTASDTTGIDPPSS